jgi:hypothetical protein
MPRLFSIVLCDHPAQLNSEKLQLRAIQIRQTGGPEVMRLRETPTRRPGKGEVLIRVEASGVQGRERPRRPPLSGRVLDSTSLGPGPHHSGGGSCKRRVPYPRNEAEVCTSEARKIRVPLARARGGASQEGLVSLLGAERMRSHFAVAVAMGPALRAGTRLLRNCLQSQIKRRLQIAGP